MTVDAGTGEGAPTLAGAIAAQMAAEGKRKRMPDPAKGRRAARLPVDGSAVAGLGLGPKDGAIHRPVGDLGALAARGSTIGRLDDGTTVVAYRDLVVALHPYGWTTSVALVKWTRPGDASLDLAGLAASSGDQLLTEDEIAARFASPAGRDEPGTELGTLRERLDDVLRANGSRHGLVVRVRHPSEGPEEPLGAAAWEGPLDGAVAGHAAAVAGIHREHRLTRGGHPCLASSWRDGRVSVMGRLDEEGGSATMTAAASGGRAARAAARRIVGWLRETGAPGELVARVRAEWLGDATTGLAA